MARKSRKNMEPAAPQSNKTKVFQAGGYVRLSAVDKKQKAMPRQNIVNLRKMIKLCGIKKEDD